MYNFVDAGIVQLCETYGLDSFTIRYAICLLGSFPLNAIFKRLPDKRINLKCVYIISISFFYLFGVLNLATGFKTLFISTTFTYLITRFFHSRFMPHVNFVFIMGHLAMNHIIAHYRSDSSISSSIDITSAQMVLVMKLTSFAWSYHDGVFLSKDEFNTQLTKYQQTRAVRKHPSILRFYSYVFFYSTLLTGPSFDFVDFDSWLNCEMFSDLPEDKKPQNRYSKAERRQIPKNGRLALWKIIQGFFWMALNAYVPRYINLSTVLNQELFSSYRFIYKIHYIYLLGLATRFRYYAAWTISEGSCILCGLSYNGYDAETGKIKWNRVQNIDIKGVETAQSTRDCLEAWNMNTNKWLKYSVYLRVTKIGTKPGFRATLFTFLTSAFWHGFSAGYYLTFGTAALYQTCGKFFRRNFRPIFLQKDGVTPTRYKWIYDILGDYVIKLAFGYMILPFIALNFRDSIKAWKSVYFYGHIIIAISFFIFRGPFSKQFVKFCKSLQPSTIEVAKQKKLEKEISTGTGSLSDIIKQKIEYEIETKEKSELDPLEREDMNLGIPTISPNDWEDAKEDFNKFLGEYNEWKDTNGMEIEEENLSKTYQNFKRELAEAANSASDSTRKMSFSSFSPKPTKKED